MLTVWRLAQWLISTTELQPKPKRKYSTFSLIEDVYCRLTQQPFVACGFLFSISNLQSD